jgi:hypothetical protein
LGFAIAVPPARFSDPNAAKSIMKEGIRTDDGEVMCESHVSSPWPDDDRPVRENRIFYVYDLSTVDSVAIDDKSREFGYALVSAGR